MNRILAFALIACAVLAAVSHITGIGNIPPAADVEMYAYAGFSLSYTCLAVALAALCGFMLYGNPRR